MRSGERTADELRDWAQSGAVWLTGPPDGPPLVPPGRAATSVRENLRRLGLAIPGLLGERAAYAKLGRSAPWSCGGAFRMLPTADGWLGVSLARPADLEAVPALVESAVEHDPWKAVAAWAARKNGAAAQERLRLLGLPGGVIASEPPRDRAGVVTTALGTRQSNDSPVVVDLTSMWAGPLSAHLLRLTGARVIKVESAHRPDGARFGPRAFYDLLHARCENVVLDFRTQVDDLHRLLSRADLVLEASRPRALRNLGVVAEDVVAAGTSWLSITAHGRSSDAVGFGDDVAASAGMVVCREDGDPVPAGDALADPITGVAAAVAAHSALRSDDAVLIDVSMRHVVAETLDRSGLTEAPVVAVPGPSDTWWLERGDAEVLVAPPVRRLR